MLVPASFVLLPTLLGAGYEDVPTIMVLLIPGLVAQSGLKALDTFFIVQLGKPGTISRLSLLTMGTNLPLSLALVPVAGAHGAALAATGAFTAGTVGYFWRFRAETGVSPRECLPRLEELRDYRELATALRKR